MISVAHGVHVEWGVRVTDGDSRVWAGGRIIYGPHLSVYNPDSISAECEL